MSGIYVIRSRGPPFNMRSPTRKGWHRETPPMNHFCAVEYHNGFVAGTCFSSADTPNPAYIVSNVHWAYQHRLDGWLISKTVAKESILELAKDILSSHLHSRALWHKYYPADENPFERYFTSGSFPPLTYELDGTQILMLVNGVRPANAPALRPLLLSLEPAPPTQTTLSSPPLLPTPAIANIPDSTQRTSIPAAEAYLRPVFGDITNSGYPPSDTKNARSSTVPSSEDPAGDKTISPSSSSDSLTLDELKTIIDAFPLPPVTLPSRPKHKENKTTNVGPIRTPRTPRISRPRLGPSSSRRSSLASVQELRSAEEEGEVEANVATAMRRQLAQLSASSRRSAPSGRLSLDLMNHFTR